MKNLSEDDIKIIDNRGKYAISKWVVWSVVILTILIIGAFTIKVVKQARFIATLTSNTPIEQCVIPVSDGKIHITEINGSPFDMELSRGYVKWLYKSLDMVPKSISKNPRKDLQKAYHAFQTNIGQGHQTEFVFDAVRVKVEYQDGKAYRYSFTNSMNNYSMTVVCPYDDLISILDGVVK